MRESTPNYGRGESTKNQLTEYMELCFSEHGQKKRGNFTQQK